MDTFGINTEVRNKNEAEHWDTESYCLTHIINEELVAVLTEIFAVWALARQQKEEVPTGVLIQQWTVVQAKVNNKGHSSLTDHVILLSVRTHALSCILSRVRSSKGTNTPTHAHVEAYHAEDKCKLSPSSADSYPSIQSLSGVFTPSCLCASLLGEWACCMHDLLYICMCVSTCRCNSICALNDPLCPQMIQ